MKKVLFSLLSVIFLFGMTSCEKVEEGNLVGKWQQVSESYGGETANLGNEGPVYEFSADHILYISDQSEKSVRNAGEWQLSGSTIIAPTWYQATIKISKLTSTELVLKIDEDKEYFGAEAMSGIVMKFKRL